MEHTAIRRRLPRAGIDVIDDADTALATIAMAIDVPLQAETIVLLLDDARRGRAIVVISGTEAPDSVIEVIECITLGDGCEELGAVIVCSVRPPRVPAWGPDMLGSEIASSGRAGDAGATDVADEMDDVDVDDIDRWLEMSEIASLAGVELLEWFVIGRSISCPRDLLGEPPRW